MNVVRRECATSLRVVLSRSMTFARVSCTFLRCSVHVADFQLVDYAHAVVLSCGQHVTKGVFIATQPNSTQLTQLNSVQPSQSYFCL